jgi:hypothetical protein
MGYSVDTRGSSSSAESGKRSGARDTTQHLIPSIARDLLRRYVVQDEKIPHFVRDEVA